MGISIVSFLEIGLQETCLLMLFYVMRNHNVIRLDPRKHLDKASRAWKYSEKLLPSVTTRAKMVVSFIYECTLAL